MDNKDNRKSDKSLFSQAATVANSQLDYALSRLSLFLLEAKIAATSVVWMLVFAVLAIIIVCSLWALANFALATWLSDAYQLSTLKVTGALAIFNSVLLLVIGLRIKTLSSGLLFQHSLNLAQDEENE